LEAEHPVVRESILFTRSKLTMEQIKIISSLPKEICYENIYVTHSIGDNYLRTKDDFKSLCKITSKDIKYISFGHTHEKIIYKCNNKIVINPGSITKGRRGFDRGYLVLNGENIQFVNLEAIL
jgi:predicted phosphodiesterase